MRKGFVVLLGNGGSLSSPPSASESVLADDMALGWQTLPKRGFTVN